MLKYLLTVFFLIFFINYIPAQELTPFKENGKIGYKDSSGNEKIQPKYLYGSKFVINKAVVGSSNDSFGVINENGDTIIPLQYEFLRLLDSTEYKFGVRAKYFGEYKMGVLDQSGNVKIPMLYDYVIKNNGYIVKVNSDSIVGKSMGNDVRAVTSKYGFYQLNGQLMLKPIYDQIDSKSENLISVDSLGFKALYSKNGIKIFPFRENQYFYYIKEGRVKFHTNRKHGFLDENGKVMVEAKYDYAKNYFNGFSMVSLNNQCGTIDVNGKIIIPIEHDCIKLTEKLRLENPGLDYEKPEL